MNPGMSLGTLSFSQMPAVAGSQRIDDAANAPPADGDQAERDQRVRDREFQHALALELEHRAHDPALTLAVPGWAPSPQELALGEVTQTQARTSLRAAGALSAANARSGSRLNLALPGRAPAPLAPEHPALDAAPKAPATTRDAHAPAEVGVVVEAGLPPVQPHELPRDGDLVPLSRFPQVVGGQVRHMVHDNQPVTQLDFHISPPQIGPVHLQVVLHDGLVNVQVVARTVAAQQALESQIGTIQGILTAQNLVPGQVRVVTAAAGKAGAHGAGDAGGKGEPGGFGLFSGGRKRASVSDDLTTGNA